MICTLMVLILYTSSRVTFSCNIHVCLTWQAEKDGISFKCKVNKLSWKVMFYDPSNKELAHCLTPFPEPKCYTSDKNTIWQSRSTNSTIFVVKHRIDTSLNGPWKCSHGTNVSEAIVNITVLKEDISKKTEKESTCYEEFSAWTMFGFTLIPVARFLIQITTTVYKCSRKRGSQCFKRIPALGLMNRSECIHGLSGHTYIYKWRYLFVCVLICTATGIPTAVGLSITECKYKESFIVLGGLLSLILLICYHNVKRFKANEPSADSVTAGNPHSLNEKNNTPIDRETDSNQQLLSDPNEPPTTYEEPSRQQISSDQNEPPAEYEESSRQQLLNVEVHQPTYLEAETKQNNF